MTRATRFIRQAAQFALNSGASVDLDSSYSTVSIDWADGGECFMQGDEADTFIDEVRALCKRYPSLDEDTAALALAWPYVENLTA